MGIEGVRSRTSQRYNFAVIYFKLTTMGGEAKQELLPSHNAPGSTPIILRSFYWSSTEYNNNSALKIAMNFGKLG